MNSGRMLLHLCEHILPTFITAIDWSNIWDRPLDTGTAFEWAVLASIIAELNTMGWQYTFPVLSIEHGSSLYPMRNEIPKQHKAQAGHSAELRVKGATLEQRFIQALLPKVLLEKDGTYYSIFREGCPYHKIMLGSNYEDRPDLIILPGRPTPSYPKIQNGILDFSFEVSEKLIITGKLRIINSPHIPCILRSPTSRIKIPVSGLVEVSTNKTAAVAVSQLQRYQELFFSSETPSMMALVTGNSISEIPYPHTIVDLEQVELDRLAEQFRSMARFCIKTFRVF